MRWQLSEEQEAYKQSFGAWLADVAPREVMRRWLDGGDARSARPGRGRRRRTAQAQGQIRAALVRWI